jgi:hypothetical protein
MVRPRSHPTVVLATTNLHIPHTQGRHRCMAILRSNHSISTTVDMLSSRTYLNINRNLA